MTALSPLDKVCADALADEVAVLVRRKVIDSRSPAADALLDYREPPSTPRADRMAQLEQELDRARIALAKADGDLQREAELRRGWEIRWGVMSKRAEAAEAALATAQVDVSRVKKEREEADLVAAEYGWRGALRGVDELLEVFLKAAHEQGQAPAAARVNVSELLLVVRRHRENPPIPFLRPRDEAHDAKAPDDAQLRRAARALAKVETLDADRPKVLDDARRELRTQAFAFVRAAQAWADAIHEKPAAAAWRATRRGTCTSRCRSPSR